MVKKKLNACRAYQKLQPLAHSFEEERLHLKNLIQDRNRLEKFSLKSDGLFLDFSRQRVNEAVMQGLFDLAEETRAKELFSSMTSGDIVNVTENRAALHTAARNFTRAPVLMDDLDVTAMMNEVNGQVNDFCTRVHDGTVTGSTGKAFTDAVVIGIGGSYLGCEFVYTALKVSVEARVRLHFLPNVDIDNFGQVVRAIDPETCLWIIISKSYTTTETMANLNQAILYLENNGLDPQGHLVTVTAKGSPGDAPSDPGQGLGSFHMFDFIGGRYSVTSAVGALPLSLAFGFDVFNRFLKGCHAMDVHAQDAPVEKNIPLTAALISIWNSNFLNYPAQAIIPYCSALSGLAPHVQQVYMESLGKGATCDGEPIDYPTGVIIFGEPGTNAQHSFFQLAHQGTPFPIEFIGVVKPVYAGAPAKSKGVTNHQELWANMIAQAQALAQGKTDDNPAKYFSGNRPSSTLLINDLTPESIGMLLSFYEARTVYEGFILGVNPFDQFGVELGKVLASGIREKIRRRNDEETDVSGSLDPAVKFYLDTLFKGCL